MNLSLNELNQLFEDFNNLNILIIGDVMVDAYFWGKVDRISPEAPVPIVSVNKKESRMGGAANVALNIQSMGATPILCSVIGNDEEGDEFIQLLQENGQSDKGIMRSEERKTTKKTRIIGNNHQMLRVDAEDDHSLSKLEVNAFFKQIEKVIQEESIDAIIFEDYDKGVINSKLIDKVVEFAEKKNIPTAVDPKKRNFTDYKKVSLFKPNLIELKEGLKIDFRVDIMDELEAAILKLESILENKITLITLSELGVYVHDKTENHHIPAHHRDITDVSGAGDTVISIAALCLAKEQSPKVIAELSNLAGGLVCETVGVVPIDKNKLKREAEKLIKGE
ncbi:MAG: bifunctional ADP-heptose synthase [Vicingaceae bacterium]